MKSLKQYGVLVVCVYALIGAGFGYAQEENAERQHRYRPEQFEQESRSEWQQVDKVIRAIGLREGHTIADIGGGSGYFSRSFAKVVGPTGVVYCCDIATNLLEYLQERAKEENLHNIVTVYAAMDRPMLPLASVDILFICDTNHHLQDRVNYHQGLKKYLKPNGKLVIIDWKKQQQKVGPPPSHNLAKEEVLQELSEAGWTLIKEETFLEYQYFLIYQP